jgi:hypothetical protein
MRKPVDIESAGFFCNKLTQEKVFGTLTFLTSANSTSSA